MKNLKILSIFLLWSLIFSREDFNELDFICDYDGDGKYDCELFNQFASNNWASNDFQGSVEQYMTMVICGCTKGQEEYVYEYLGRSYAQISKIDSSTWAFKEGLKSNPDSKILLELAAWSSGREVREGNFKKLDEQLYFLETLLEINPGDVSVLEQMSDAYKRAEMYEEQIVVLDDWLKVEPKNKKAISHKKTAFEKLGKDASEVDKERWEKESSNLEYGISYLKSLMNNEMYEEAIEVAEEILLYHDNDKRLLKLVSDVYMKNIDDANALKYLEKLIEIDPSNTEYTIKLSNVNLNLLDFEKAYSWANKAIGLNKMIGKSYFQRAEVLVQLVDYYRSDELDFCDRLIFDLAVQDYQLAYKNGVLNAKVYKNNLKELVTNIGDWFLLGDKFITMSPDSKECENIKKSDCYSFIKNREIERKN